MRYQILSEIGHHYTNEEGQSANLRHILLTRLETKLKSAIAAGQIARNNRPLPPVPGSGVPHVPTPAHILDQINTSARSARWYRDWITRQGAVVDVDGNIDWSQSNQSVVYDHDPRLQRLTKVRFRSGRLYADHSRTQRLDTRHMVTHFSGPGHAIYVMSQSGDIHVGSHSVGHRHHSSLLAGATIAAAGEIQVANGRLVSLSNKSGHYMPNLKHLCQVLHQLQKKNVPMTFRLAVKDRVSLQTFATVGDFLNDLDLNDEPDYELDKLLRYKRHLGIRALARRGWRWARAGEPLGVYVQATNVMVPHKTVRQTLKADGLSPKVKVQKGYGR